MVNVNYFFFLYTTLTMKFVIELFYTDTIKKKKKKKKKKKHF